MDKLFFTKGKEIFQKVTFFKIIIIIFFFLAAMLNTVTKTVLFICLKTVLFIYFKCKLAEALQRLCYIKRADQSSGSVFKIHTFDIIPIFFWYY